MRDISSSTSDIRFWLPRQAATYRVGRRAQSVDSCAGAGITVLLLAALSALQQRGKQPIWSMLTLVALTPLGVLAGGLVRLRFPEYFGFIVHKPNDPKSRPVVFIATGRLCLKVGRTASVRSATHRCRDNLGIRADSCSAQAIRLSSDCRRQNVEIARFGKNAHLAVAVPSGEPMRQPAANAPSAPVA